MAGMAPGRSKAAGRAAAAAAKLIERVENLEKGKP
jgi:hypothetical protein